MIETSAGLQARLEAVQPSLWDRLVDDVPGLAAESARLHDSLSGRLGAGRLAGILEGGRRSIESEAGLDPADRRDLTDLLAIRQRLAFLDQRGIVVTADVLREAVRRDIEVLFNTERFEARPVLTPTEQAGFTDPADLLADFPQVRRSVINYGVPPFSGRRARDFDTETLARDLREVLAVFEPRLKRDSIRIKVSSGDRTGLRIDIEATLMLSPVPERLRLATTIDLENGQAATRLEDR